MNHSFNVEYAVKYGVEEAIIIENFIYWVQKNRANNKHTYDTVIADEKVKRTFTYNSVKALTLLFPYMTEDVIRRKLENLRKLKILHKDVFNTNSYDRTSWYCFVEENLFCGTPDAIWQNGQMVMAEKTNGNGRKDKSYTDINTNNKPIVKEKSIVPKNEVEQEIVVLIEKDIQQKSSSLPGNYSLKNQQDLQTLISKYPLSQIKEAIPKVAMHPKFGNRFSYGGYLTYIKDFLYSEKDKEAQSQSINYFQKPKPKDGEYDGNSHSRMSFAQNSA